MGKITLAESGEGHGDGVTQNLEDVHLHWIWLMTVIAES